MSRLLLPTPRYCRIWIVLPVLLYIEFSIGCGLSSVQRQAVADFGKSTSEVGTTVESELKTMQDQTIQMNSLNYIIEGSLEDDGLDAAFNPKEVEVRIRAAKTLRDYGDLLNMLVLEDQAERIQAAADKLKNSLASLPAEVRSGNDESLEAVGKAVRFLGMKVVEYKRAKAIREIVFAHSQTVNNLADLLIMDFDPAANRLSGDFFLTLKDLDSALTIARREPRHFTTADREYFIRAQQLVEENRRRLNEAHPQARQAFTQLKRANVELHTGLQTRSASFEDMKKLGKEIKEMSDALDLF